MKEVVPKAYAKPETSPLRVMVGATGADVPIEIDSTAKPATADTPAVPEKPGTPLDPAVHGREFWQTEPSLDGQSYSIIINLPASAAVRRITAGEPPPPPAELPDQKGAAR